MPASRLEYSRRDRVARRFVRLRSRQGALFDGEDDLDQNDDKFDAGDPDWQTIDVAEAREKGSCRSHLRRRARQRAIPKRSVSTDVGLVGSPLLHPVWRPLFVERRDAFARFGGFARLHVMLQGKIDIFFHRRRPKFFDQPLGLRERVRRALQN